MIIHPPPQRAGACPRCSTALVVEAIRCSGWRYVVEGRCERCSHAYVQDLPYGHGLVYATSLDLDSGETLAPPQAEWFSKALADSWRHPDGGEVRLRVERRNDIEQRSVALLNCLDPVYGHSVLKLLNASSTGANCITLVPASLEHLVPDFVAERWVAAEPHARLRSWLLEVEGWVAKQLDRFDEVRLVPAFPHPHPSTWRIEDFVRVAPERVGNPSVIFVVRDDRLWGRDVVAQAANFAALSEALRARMPSIGVSLIGVSSADMSAVEDATDLRSSTPDAAQERRWLARARGADAAFGVHGSHMLLPSGLAATTLELLPAMRYSNTFQGTLVSDHDPLRALFRHRVVYGSDDLSDVHPDTVADILTSMLQGHARFHALMTGPAAGVGAGPASPLPTGDVGPPAPEHPYVRGRPSVRRAAGRLLARAHQRAEERQIATRVRGRLPRIMEDARGFKFELQTSKEVEGFLRHGGHWESKEVDICRSYLGAGMTAVDIGANIGAFTATFAGAVTEVGVVHAFEPVDEVRARLERTLALNGLEWVYVHNEAISDTDGSAPFYTYGPGYESWGTLGARTIDLGHSQLSASLDREVPTLRLDAWAADASIERIHLLKVDVEGAERNVLEGASRLFSEARVDMALIEVADTTLEAFGASAAELMRFLERHGFRTHVATDGGLVPFRIAGRQETLANVFAVSTTALERLRSLGLSAG